MKYTIEIKLVNPRVPNGLLSVQFSFLSMRNSRSIAVITQSPSVLIVSQQALKSSGEFTEQFFKTHFNSFASRSKADSFVVEGFI
jgi:hypothetical protein